MLCTKLCCSCGNKVIKIVTLQLVFHTCPVVVVILDSFNADPLAGIDDEVTPFTLRYS